MKRIPGQSFLIILLLFWAGFSVSCRKAVENIQENLAYEIITNGRWVVTRFDVNEDPKASEYNGFEFQFFRSGVVTAFKTGSADINGTWAPDPVQISITSNFPGVGEPLSRFNGKWIITRTTETTVQASRTEGANTLVLGLRKV